MLEPFAGYKQSGQKRQMPDEQQPQHGLLMPVLFEYSVLRMGPFTVTCVDVLKATQLVGFVHCEHGILA